MKFDCFDTNNKLIQRMENVVKNDKVSHAYIFEGLTTEDKIAFVKSFIKGILCPDRRGENCGRCCICEKIDHNNHEDIMFVGKDGNFIKDSSVSSIQEKLNVKPIGKRNIIVIEDADALTKRAQNRLLKTLEEPPGDSVIILLSKNIENLAQTILSRCVKYRLETNNVRERDRKAEKIIAMSLEGNPFYAIVREAGDCLKEREDAEFLLDSMEETYRSFLTVKDKNVPLYTFEDIYRNIHEIEKSRKMISQGMSCGYVLKNLFLHITE